MLCIWPQMTQSVTWRIAWRPWAIQHSSHLHPFSNSGHKATAETSWKVWWKLRCCLGVRTVAASPPNSAFKNVTMGVFTPWKLKNAANQDFFFFPGKPVVKHLSSCHWLDLKLPHMYLLRLWLQDWNISSRNFGATILDVVWFSINLARHIAGNRLFLLRCVFNY